VLIGGILFKYDIYIYFKNGYFCLNFFDYIKSGTMDVNCFLNGCTLIVEVWLPIDIRKGLKGCQLLMDPLGTKQLMSMAN